MLAFVCVTLIATAAASPAVEKHLAAAQAYADDLDFEAAAAELEQVLADPKASEAEKKRAHYQAAIVSRVMERDAEAMMHLQWVLERDPDAAPPPGASPKITNFFALVRENFQKRTSTTSGPTSTDSPDAPDGTPDDILSSGSNSGSGNGASSASSGDEAEGNLVAPLAIGAVAVTAAVVVIAAGGVGAWYAWQARDGSLGSFQALFPMQAP